jgi:hypothetical protein
MFEKGSTQHCKDTNAKSALFYFFNLQSVISVPRWNFDDLVGEFTIIPIKFPNMITKIVIQEPVIEIPEKSLETAKPNLRSRLLSTDVKNALEKVLLPKFQIMGSLPKMTGNSAVHPMTDNVLRMQLLHYVLSK